MRFIKGLSDTVYTLEKFLVVLLLPALLLSLFSDVVFRYIFNSPLLWAQETALFTFIFASFIGASMSVKVREAVAVTILVDRVNESLRNVLIIIGMIISLIFTVAIFYLSVKWILNPNILLQRSVTTQIPMIIPYLSIPISLLFMIVHFVYLLIESFHASNERQAVE
ncbi:TRAP transporter small permease [Sporosarcina sp. P7]|uniref:TRAP transporter small permease n=1 Tax=Sporosarcina sp. P7 TaxID=2048244 RepID=UPI000C1695D7|nr:TRAP transporter small permease subunit [Sporosarcina sp. P7]PID24071.1 TRAP transporter permease DctQ [Sporosarcina sp. P7]